MKTDTAQFEPRYSRSPGEYLSLVLTERGIKKVDFAAHCGRTTKLVSEILAGKASITPETALQFERVLAIAATTWLNYEAQYRLALQKQDDQLSLKQYSTWANRFPIHSLTEHGCQVDAPTDIEKIQNILAFFGVANVEAWETVANQRASGTSFKQSTAFKADPYAVHAWLRMCELKAQKIETVSYDEKCFRRALSEIRGLTTLPWPAFEEDLQHKCASCGVAVVIASSFPRTGLSGAAQWINKDKALIILSDRYKSDDHFWFSFYHEAAHILLHSKKDIYIDENSNINTEQETEANEFAARTLIPNNFWTAFFKQHPEKKGRFSEKNIRSFASDAGISPSIVLGQLQHNKYLPPHTVLNKKIRKSFRVR